MRRREEARFAKSRRLGFELLEERQMLSVTLDVISQPGIPSSTPAGSSSTAGDGMSSDGRYVLFGSNAPNLAAASAVPANTYNLYRYDRVLRESVPIIVSLDGTFGANASIGAAFISDDGNTIVFSTKATNLHPLDQDGDYDVYARNMLTGQNYLVSVNESGNGTGNADSWVMSVSADGSRILYSSAATNLSVLDANTFNDLYVRDLMDSTTHLVTIDAAHQGAGNGRSSIAVLSANGRVVAFESEASNLDPRDTDATKDIFAHDLETGLTTLVSVGLRTAGYVPRRSHSPSVSDDGKIVAFVSESNILHPLDTDTDEDLFARDLVNQVTHLVSVSSSGTTSANAQILLPDISADGSTLVYSSRASNLHPLASTLGEMNMFVRNLDTGITKLASVNRTGTGGQNDEWVDGFLSSNGRFVVMITTADNLTFDAPNSATFLHDLQTGITRPVKMNLSGSASSGGRSIDATGRYITVQSGSSGIVDNDFNLLQDVFLVDMQSNEIQHISATDPSKPQSTANAASTVRYHESAMSADGRYVVYMSKANNLLEEIVVNTDEWTTNIYRYDRLLDRVELVSANSAGNNVGNSSSYSPSISADGRMIAFVSLATNLASGSLSGYYQDIFVRDMETGVTQLMSRNVGGFPSGYNDNPRISADGRVVTYETTSTAVHPLKTTSTQDIIARNLVTGATHLVTQSATGQSGGNQRSYSTGMSADGSVVLFTSEASNLHPLDTHSWGDVYARNLVTGTTHLVSVDSSGITKGNNTSSAQAISADGTRIAFSSSATNLDPLDPSNGADLYLRDLVLGTTQLVSIDPVSNGPMNDQEEDHEYSMSSDGRSVLYGGKKLYVTKPRYGQCPTRQRECEWRHW